MFLSRIQPGEPVRRTMITRRELSAETCSMGTDGTTGNRAPDIFCSREMASVPSSFGGSENKQDAVQF